MRLRRITQAEVAEAIAQPDLCTTSRFDRTVVWAKVRGRRLRIAYEVRQSGRIIVVSAVAPDEPDIARAAIKEVNDV
jgi:hypothetical protein